MTRFSRPLLLILSFVMLAGCWESEHGPFYGNVPLLTPFRSGDLAVTGGDKPESYTITLKPDSGYRLVSSEKDGQGRDDGFDLRLFAIPGLPPGMIAYEAIAITYCDTKFVCDAVAAADARYYGLLRPIQDGATEIRPDCEKDAAFIDKARMKIEDGVCTFPDRATLETSLRAIAAADTRKPDRVFRYR